jgi:hypothetical protein
MNDIIIYSNSCSFGAPNQGHQIYPEIISNLFNGNLINDGIPGSCNRRIIRTSLRSLIELKSKHKNPIIALVGLSFISRTELWQPHLPPTNTDGDFHPIKNDTIESLNWANGLLGNDRPDVYKFADKQIRDYYKQWLIHYSKESVITDLITDLIMFIEFTKSLNIYPLIFSNCQLFPSLPEVDPSAPFLQSLLSHFILKKEIINPWEFSFATHALSLGHLPKDKEKYGLNGHPNEQAHKDFGNFLGRCLVEKFPNLLTYDPNIL